MIVAILIVEDMIGVMRKLVMIVVVGIHAPQAMIVVALTTVGMIEVTIALKLREDMIGGMTAVTNAHMIMIGVILTDLGVMA